MQKAAKEKTAWLLSSALAMLFCASAIASSHTLEISKPRAEFFLLGVQNGVGPPPVSPETASSYYDSFGKVALESSVAPKSAVTRTNSQLVQDIGTRAEAWGTRRGLSTTGSVEGTLKHGYADRVLTRYQRMFGDRSLSTEVRYINGRPWLSGDGVRGSVRLDVVEGALNNPAAVFDYKFGNAVLSNSRINQIRRIGGFGPNVPVTPIHP